MKFLLILPLTLLFTSGPVKAETLAEKKYWKEQTEYLQKEEIGPMNEKCETKISAEFDKGSFSKWKKETHSAYGYCGHVLGTMRSMCAEEDAKKEITAKIKKVICKAAEGEKLEFKLSSGTLTFTFGGDASNLDEKAKKWLENNL